MESSRALIVRGGWQGHQPVACTDLFVPFLASSGFELTVADTLDVYADPSVMSGLDLIVQCWTRGELTVAQESGLLAAVVGGTGFAGWHGGVIATHGAAMGYQFMVGGRFICHPGDLDATYDVEVDCGHPITAGVDDFEVRTEQYFCHVDPSLTVLATTTFTGAHGAPETAGAVMPVVWLRDHGRGRVFVSTLGHAPEDLVVPQTRTLTERGLLWAGRRF